MTSQEGLGPLDDVADDDCGSQGEDEVLVIRMEDETLLDFSYKGLGAFGGLSYLRSRRRRRFLMASPLRNLSGRFKFR